MNKLSAFFYFFIFSTLVFGQQDPEAKRILDEFSAKTKSYKAYGATFSISSENHQNGQKSATKGSILIEKNKYKIVIDKNEIYFDGKDVYNYTKQSNEVSIVKPEKSKDDFFLSNPVKMFTIFPKEYKFQYLGEITVMSRTCYEVDLYPKEIKRNYSIIKLIIDKEKLQLVIAQAKMKSGVDYTVNIENFNPNANATDSDFSFDTKVHKDVEVVDLR
jgi:outer membrane lipoprotein-sorting protein